MSKLLVQELRLELSQDFTLGLNVRHHIAAFIPCLYIHNAPVGTFSFEILKDAVSIFQKSFDSEDILNGMETSDDYAFAFYPVIPSQPLQLEGGSYQAKLSASGYSSSNASFLGWIQQHEDIQNEMDYVPKSDSENPLAMRIKTYKQGVLCQG